MYKEQYVVVAMKEYKTGEDCYVAAGGKPESRRRTAEQLEHRVGDEKQATPQPAEPRRKRAQTAFQLWYQSQRDSGADFGQGPGTKKFAAAAKRWSKLSDPDRQVFHKRFSEVQDRCPCAGACRGL